VLVASAFTLYAHRLAHRVWGVAESAGRRQLGKPRGAPAGCRCGRLHRVLGTRSSLLFSAGAQIQSRHVRIDSTSFSFGVALARPVNSLFGTTRYLDWATASAVLR
jgi:hypothetical protein